MPTMSSWRWRLCMERTSRSWASTTSPEDVTVVVLITSDSKVISMMLVSAIGSPLLCKQSGTGAHYEGP
jgi:hypothetical protein